MNEKLKSLLKLIGLKPESIELFTDEAKKEELEKLKVEDLVSEVQTTFEGKLKNDQAFRSEIETQVRGKVLGSKQRLIQKLVPELTNEEIDALDDKTKFDDMLELAVKKVVERKGGKKEDENEILKTAKAEAKKWQDEYNKLKDEEIPRLQSEHQTALDDVNILNQTMSYLNSKKDDVLGNKEFIAKSILAESRDKYVMKLVDGKAKLYQKPKEGSTGDLLEVYDGNEVLTFDKSVDKFLESNQLVRKSNANPGGDKGNPPNPNPNPAPSSTYNLPGLAAAKAHVEEM